MLDAPKMDVPKMDALASLPQRPPAFLAEVADAVPKESDRDVAPEVPDAPL